MFFDIISLYQLSYTSYGKEEDMKKDAAYYIKTLGLEAHVEGGYFREYLVGTQKIDLDKGQTRDIYTSIFFLIEKHNISHFHRLQVDEVWYYHAGNPLTIYMLSEDGELSKKRLGLDIENGEMPRILVPAGYWFG